MSPAEHILLSQRHADAEYWKARDELHFAVLDRADGRIDAQQLALVEQRYVAAFRASNVTADELRRVGARRPQRRLAAVPTGHRTFRGERIAGGWRVTDGHDTWGAETTRQVARIVLGEVFGADAAEALSFNLAADHLEASPWALTEAQLRAWAGEQS